ncbi:hypothetical protein [Halocatena halophila]|uniref:hypothetical protein n=1 Tax=Halocatena halophila TaxID=2814576 RepID=UPI002ED43763
MKQSLVSLLPSVRVRPIERGLAVGFLCLLLLYGFGTILESSLPALHTAGVLGMHLAVAVALLLLLLILSRSRPCSR